MSERRRASKLGKQRWESLSDEAKEAYRDRGRRQWQELSDERRAEIRSKQEATRNLRYPFRPAQYADFCRARDAGEIPLSQPCPGCGGVGRPEVRFDDEHDEPTAWRIVGWRCYPCRKAAADA